MEIQKIYGIIDWDGKNEDGDFVKVIACGKRYSTENLIFDPLLLGVYLIRETLIKPEEVGFNANLNYIKLANLNAKDCEKLASFIVGCVKKILPDKKNENSTIASYLGDFKISTSDWYFLMNGHELEEAVKITFPQLKRFRNENDLKNDIIKKVMSDFPQFVPTDFHTLFESIQIQHLA